MYKDIITYQLADGITKDHLLNVAHHIIDDWMKSLPGFIKWEIHHDHEGNYTDIVYWESREAALNAENEMANIPNGEEWYACYKEGSIQGKKLITIGSFE